MAAATTRATAATKRALCAMRRAIEAPRREVLLAVLHGADPGGLALEPNGQAPGAVRVRVRPVRHPMLAHALGQLPPEAPVLRGGSAAARAGLRQVGRRLLTG